MITITIIKDKYTKDASRYGNDIKRLFSFRHFIDLPAIRPINYRYIINSDRYSRLLNHDKT